MVTTVEPVESADALELLAHAREGDAPAFCCLIEAHQARLFRQAAALTPDLPAAEDLVSETLVAAWKSLHRYNESCRFSTWLYAILMHRHQDSVRRARARPLSMARLPLLEARGLREQQANQPSAEPSPVEAAVQNEAARELRRCLGGLPEKHRQIIQLRFFADASLPEMAEVLDCSIGTVKSRLHHALENLRKMKLNLPDPGSDSQL